MRRLLFSLALILLSAAAFAQPWTPLSSDTNCVGGNGCREKRLRIALEDKPVTGVRFHAHDNIGEKADGALRVKIDGNTIRGSIDIPRRGETFTLDVDELRGRYRWRHRLRGMPPATFCDASGVRGDGEDQSTL